MSHDDKHDETAWLVERPDGNGFEYLKIIEGPRYEGWTTDIDKACRFISKEQAQGAIGTGRMKGFEEAEAKEHMWPAPSAPSSTPQNGDVEWLHQFLNCVVFGPPPSEVQRAHRIVDALTSRLMELEKENHRYFLIASLCQTVANHDVGEKLDNPPISHPVIDAVLQLQAERDAAVSATRQNVMHNDMCDSVSGVGPCNCPNVRADDGAKA